MKRTIILLIALVFYLGKANSQETFLKDSIEDNYGVFLEVQSGFSAAFIQLGVDYNHRINSRISIGGAASFGIGGSENNCYKFNINPYLRLDLMKNRFSPFIDLGVGYDITSWRSVISSYQNLVDKHTSQNFLISSRLGVFLANRKSFNLALVVQYQKFFPESGFAGFGLIYSLKK